METNGTRKGGSTGRRGHIYEEIDQEEKKKKHSKFVLSNKNHEADSDDDNDEDEDEVDDGFKLEAFCGLLRRSAFDAIYSSPTD